MAQDMMRDRQLWLLTDILRFLTDEHKTNGILSKWVKNAVVNCWRKHVR